MIVAFASPGLPDAATRARYAAGCATHGATLHWATVAGLSSAFERLADILVDGERRILPSLLRRYAPDLAGPVVLVGFSAGCWLVRRAIAHPLDADAVAGVVYLDGLHGTGAALDGSVAYAERARAGRCICYLGHSDVPTAGYPSTTQTAAEMLARVGPPAGGWRCDAHDVEPPARAKAEHCAALTGWGPALVGEALAAVDALAVTAAPTERSPAMPGTIGERAVMWSLAEMDLDGGQPTSAERVAAYLAPCVRRGADGLERPLRLRRGNWCAGGACAALVAAGGEGDGLPEYRASGFELERDAREAGTWHPLAEVLAGTWEPAVGDLCVLQRGVPGSWGRHVCRLVRRLGATHIETLGGNELRNRWALTVRPLAAPVLGFVELPRPVARIEHTAETGRLLRLSDDIARGLGHDPMAALERLDAAEGRG